MTARPRAPDHSVLTSAAAGESAFAKQRLCDKRLAGLVGASRVGNPSLTSSHNTD